MTKQKRHRTAPKKQLRAVQTSRHWRMAPHCHTGHVLPSHSTSYPVLTMIVLCVGVLLFSWTLRVTADQSYAVHASVPGPPPSVAATIDSPADTTVFTTKPVTISGSCPLNTYVAVMRNHFSSGVALCGSTGQYQLTTDLFAGPNQLVVYDYSFTDAQGPASNTVTAHYVPPAPPPSSPSSGGSSLGTGGTSSTASGTGPKTGSQKPYTPGTPVPAGTVEPLVLKSNFTFLGYYIGQPASWQVDIEGGTPPYALAAAWGDGSQQLYSRAKPGSLGLQHTYAKTGGFHGSYVVKITATDAKGQQTFLQLLAIVTSPPKAVVAGSGDQDQNSGLAGGISNVFTTTSLGRLVAYTWSGYGVVILMLFSFWLGERRELRYFHFKPKRPRHA